MKPLSMQQWTFASITVMAMVIVGLAGFSWNYAQQTLAASAFVSHTHKVIGLANELASSVHQAESNQRAFLLTRRADFLAQRDTAVERFDTVLSEVVQLTVDNPLQQSRLVDLRTVLTERVSVFRETETLVRRNQPVMTEEIVARGARVSGHMHSLLRALLAEESRLLDERVQVEGQRAVVANSLFYTFIAALIVLLPLIVWRIKRDALARQQAEQQVEEEKRYDGVHSRALTLYNEQPTREGVLGGTLDLLAELTLFPASVFYAYEELGGSLRAVSSHAAPEGLRPVVRMDDGPIGTAARNQKPVCLDRLDGDSGMRIEGGLAKLAPVAMLMHPVVYQGRLMGVLVLAVASPMKERDHDFVSRLCAQMGVALHNLGQVQELSLLAEQLRSRGEDIQLKNAELERANRMKSEFLANMSHELRTPLNAVIGFSEILKDGMVGDLTGEQVEYITDIFNSGKHLLSLINDILDLSKVESGHSPLDLEPVEPLTLATSGVTVMKEKASTHAVRLHSVCDPALGRLCLDMRKAKQIIYNLLANSVKFTPEGGEVTMTMKRVSRTDVAVYRDGVGRVFLPADLETHESFLSIAVADTGIGIEPADLARLFEPFVQIDSSLSRKYAGTGLGLMMVKRLAELHGGGLMVTSVPEKGSVFTVWLPWREPSADAEEHTSAAVIANTEALAALPRPSDTSSPLVLVVDDEPRTADRIGAQLRDQGYQVAFASTAEEGLQQAMALKPAALVLDIVLPGMNGWDMLTRLKDHADTRNIPVVIVSVTTEVHRGFALGASQVLTKPVSKEDLLAAVASLDLDGDAMGAEVLVVDDDPKAVTLVSKHLESAGFRPLQAFSGHEALDMVRGRLPALIILDLMMPELSGFDVVQALRSRPDTADVPVIVLTAKLLTADDRTLLRGLVEQVMEKSDFQSTSLLAEVKRALAKRRARQTATGDA
jgi:signal transduction histidine kinase/DNA-binding response OmpR family regulator/CHASE3 domain sensor protein